jgi:tagatose 1,6-diphosphate aldolase GatY/KbaY
MPLTTSETWLRRAQAEGWAVPGFAAYNLETVKTLVATAARHRSPVFLQTTWGTIEHAGIEYLSALTRIAAERLDIPVFLHLDHGQTLDQVEQCLGHGYTSIMLDASRHAWEDNVRLTREAVRMAHAVRVPVEAELGRIPGVEDDLSLMPSEALLTDPEEAARFARETGIDSLAVSVGTAHGMYRRPPAIDFARLEALCRAVPVPLVLHGVSGVPDADVVRAVRVGVSKINIASELKVALADALRAYLNAHPEQSDPRRYFPPALDAYRRVVEEKIALAGSAGRA